MQVLSGGDTRLGIYISLIKWESGVSSRSADSIG
jgi:hypothetical protein